MHLYSEYIRKMTKLNPDIVPIRGKTLKIACSEELALEIVRPLVDLTAYLLSVSTTTEMPELQSMVKSIATSKNRLATLMATSLGRIVLPKNLGTIGVDVIPFGGYFKITVTERCALPMRKQSVQHFIVHLQCATSCTLVDKLSTVLKNTNKANGIEMTDEEFIDHLVLTSINMGL